MHPDPIDVVKLLLSERAAGNFDRVHALCAQAFAFTFNADPDKIGNGTTIIGWRGIQAHFENIKANWVEESREMLGIASDQFNPEKVHVRIAFRVRRIKQPIVVEGVKRMIFVIREGVAVSCEEVFDRHAIHAAQRLGAANDIGPVTSVNS
jgi:hypothetical protein